jgi:periplasmic protein TonB
MSYVRLITFVFLSSVIHILALFMVAGFFQPKGIITKPQLIQVGVVIENKNPGVGSGHSLEPPSKEAPKPEKKAIVKQKEPSKVEKKVAKTLSKKKQEIPKNEEKVEQIEKSVVKKNNLASSQNTHEGSEQSTASSATTLPGIGSSKEGKGFSNEGSGNGGESAYPDYNLNPKPKYPMIARMSGYEGKVLLKVLVLKNGKVGKIDMEKSSGYGILDKSAIESVENWIFIPGKKNGIPISSWVEVPIRFELSSG